jgi:small-conductance mechanosensitive channel
MNLLSVWFNEWAWSEVVLQVVWLLGLSALTYVLVRWGHQRWARGGQKRVDTEISAWVLDGVAYPLVLWTLLTLWLTHLQHAHEASSTLALVQPLVTCWLLLSLVKKVLLFVFPQSAGMRALERLMSYAVVLLSLLWVTGWLPEFLLQLEAVHLSFGKTQLSVRNLIEGLASCVAVLIFSLWLSALLERQLIEPALDDLSLRKVASNVLRGTLLVLGLLFSMSALGLDLTALSVLGGAFGVGLGLGMQKLAANYVSGFVILLERSIRIGDVVKIDDFEGKITDIKTRFTLIRSYGGRESIVPNEQLLTQRIENLSLNDPHVLLSTSIVLGAEVDVSSVQQMLETAALTSPRVLPDPAPCALLEAFEADGLRFKLQFWIVDPEHGQLKALSEVNCAILAQVKARGLRLPVPQREWTFHGALPVRSDPIQGAAQGPRAEPQPLRHGEGSR